MALGRRKPEPVADSKAPSPFVQWRGSIRRMAWPRSVTRPIGLLFVFFSPLFSFLRSGFQGHRFGGQGSSRDAVYNQIETLSTRCALRISHARSGFTVRATPAWPSLRLFTVVYWVSTGFSLGNGIQNGVECTLDWVLTEFCRQRDLLFLGFYG